MRVLNVTRGTVLGDSVAVAGDSQTRRTGLLKHTGLADGEGLWIAPCEAVHTFGMKFVIDVAFLNKARKVVKIRREMPKRRMSLCFTGYSVLELPAGKLEKTGTQKGDQLEFEKLP